MSTSAGGVRQPRKLSEVTEKAVPRRSSVAIRPVAVVTAFSLEVGWSGVGRPSVWLVSSLCPFGCESRVHIICVPVDYFGLWGEVKYCVVAEKFYSVIIPEALLISAQSLLVES